MPAELWLVWSLLGLCLILLLVVLLLIRTVVQQSRESQYHLRAQLAMAENRQQSLMNQLRSESVGTLMGLNQATLPKGQVASNSDVDERPLTSDELGDAIRYEEDLAEQGYKLAEPPDELAGMGWGGVPIRTDQ